MLRSGSTEGRARAIHMPLSSLFRRPPHEAVATALFDALVVQARTPAFYARLAVPDTIDGRFDLLLLHVFLLLQRLQDDPRLAPLAQPVVDRMFAILDLNLREMGVQDVGIGRRIKIMAQAFNGRTAAYRTALADGAPALRAALHRNLYAEAAVPEVVLDALAHYVLQMQATLAATPAADLHQGKLALPSLPGETQADR